MKIDLPDVNVWLALMDDEHAMHSAARHYWDNSRLDRFAFCRVTMLGLFRLATNPRAMYSGAYTFAQVWTLYEDLIALPEAAFLAEPDLESGLKTMSLGKTFKQSRWTDAYLTAFANVTGSRLVTFDKGFRHLDVGQLLILEST